MSQAQLSLRGKIIGPQELQTIRYLSEKHYLRGMTFISRKVCEALYWLQPNGKLQDVACREILRRLEGLVCLKLPPARKIPPNERGLRQEALSATELAIVPREITGSIEEFPRVTLVRVEGRKQAKVWAGLIERYHYLGYRWTVGRSVKYFLYIGEDLIGAMSWGSACWKLACRDMLIGWDAQRRARNLGGIAGNHRFLIAPWVKVRNLASHILSLAVKQLPKDWKAMYGLELYLLESFVDPQRFKGSCYKAANWIYLGQSKGASKSGNGYHWHGQVKDIYVYPLSHDFRERLSS